MRFRFTIRDLLWLTVVVALAVGWRLYAVRTNETIQQLRQQVPPADSGMPFGAITDEDIDRLNVYAKRKGEDLKSDANKMYDDDFEALRRVFRFSLQFDHFDQNCRTYGQIVYSRFLKLGEAWGVERYAKVLSSESSDVQQRVRDFNCYPATLKAPQEQKACIDETKKMYPRCFHQTMNSAKAINSSAYQTDYYSPPGTRCGIFPSNFLTDHYPSVQVLRPIREVSSTHSV